MAAMDFEDELPSLSSTSRVPRALTLIVVSIVTITIAGIAYLHPALNSGSASSTASAPADNLPTSYDLAALDFVTPTTGWVVARLRSGDFAVLHTADAGETWKRQLVGSAGLIGEYMRFFDSVHGILVSLGPQSVMYQTSDGGSTWNRKTLTQGGGYIWSVDFIDASHGWLVTQASQVGPTPTQMLLRTADGGHTWESLGSPVRSGDWAYRVVFADQKAGWLYSKSAGPYAYRSEDAGTTWRRVTLPAPPGGWPAPPAPSVLTETFFVAAHPTEGAGVMTTVIGVAPPHGGRSSGGGVLVDYPPLKVSTFDGGQSVTYIYADVSPYRYASIEYVNPGPFVTAEPEDQYQLSSVDGGHSWSSIQVPSTYGAVGYVDALNWWWIGSGARSTSSDAGTTWGQVQAAGVTEPLPGSLQFIDASHAWFGAMAGTRPLLEATDDGGIHWRMMMLPAITPS